MKMKAAAHAINCHDKLVEALNQQKADTYKIIDHLTDLGIDEAWTICKLNNMHREIKQLLSELGE